MIGREFFEQIWQGEGWAWIACKDHTEGNTEKSGWTQQSFKYPEEFGTLYHRLTVWNEQDMRCVYFVPHLFRDKFRKVKDASLPSHCFWVDKDAGPLEDIINYERPSICWSTSDRRYQALWLLDESVDPNMVEYVNQRICTKVKGDKGGHFAGKFLRVPGSMNHKYRPPQEGVILWYSADKTFKVSDFIEATKPESVEVSEDLAMLQPPPKLADIKTVLQRNGDRIPRAAWTILKSGPKRGEDWSQKLWNLEMLLLRAEIPPADVYVIVKNSQWNKYERDGRPTADLWREIMKASKDISVKLTPEEETDIRWYELDDLLTYQEQPQFMVEDIWMDKNVGWIVGEGKSYKSIVSLDLALSVASGKPFLDTFKVLKPGPVLMVQEEDPLWRVAHRLQAMIMAKGLMPFEPLENPSSSEWANVGFKRMPMNCPLYITTGSGITFNDKSKMDGLERALDEKQPKLLVLDPMFMMTLGYDEFKSGDITYVLNKLKQWRNDYNCAIAVVHHNRKSKEGSDTERIYGSMALYAWSENSLMMERVGNRSDNAVKIRLDIKDAAGSPEIAIKFNNIGDDGKYDFEVARERDTRVNSRDIILQSLPYEKKYGLGIDELCKAHELPRGTVKSGLEDLVDQGLVRRVELGSVKRDSKDTRRSDTYLYYKVKRAGNWYDN